MLSGLLSLRKCIVFGWDYCFSSYLLHCWMCFMIANVECEKQTIKILPNTFFSWYNNTLVVTNENVLNLFKTVAFSRICILQRWLSNKRINMHCLCQIFWYYWRLVMMVTVLLQSIVIRFWIANDINKYNVKWRERYFYVRRNNQKTKQIHSVTAPWRHETRKNLLKYAKNHNQLQILHYIYHYHNVMLSLIQNLYARKNVQYTVFCVMFFWPVVLVLVFVKRLLRLRNGWKW